MQFSRILDIDVLDHRLKILLELLDNRLKEELKLYLFEKVKNKMCESK